MYSLFISRVDRASSYLGDLPKKISFFVTILFQLIFCFVAANAQTPSGPVFHLNFDSDDFSTTNSDEFKTRKFEDKSSNKILVDCQSAWRANEGTVFDQCPAVTVGPDGSKAAALNGEVLCDRAADYLAVAKHPAIASLPQGSLTFFELRNDINRFNHEIIDTDGYLQSRVYKVHRDGDDYVTFTLNTNAGRETDIFTFPAGTVTTGRWNHYAITWDGSVIKGYFNGLYIGQAPMLWTSSLDISTYLGIGTMIHGTLRNTLDGGNCVNQYKYPAGDYRFPNAGFMSGKIDDVRIYNRVITPLEVQTLSNQNTSPPAEFIVRASKSGNGWGDVATVNSNGDFVRGIGCGKHCAETFNFNPNPTAAQKIYLKAFPHEGSIFTGWSGGCTGTGLCEIPQTGNFEAQARFEREFAQVAFFEAEAGTVTAPFAVSEGAVNQFADTGDNIPIAGRAIYPFTISEAGEYIIAATVNAPSQSSNSFFVTVSTDPNSDPTLDNAWHMATTGGFDERFVSWGGFTSGSNPTKIFNLTPGNYYLIIRARESETALDNITIIHKGATPSRPLAPSGLRLK